MASNSERLIAIKTSTILKIIGILVLLWFVWLVRDILALLLVALFLAALMHPAVRWGARHRIPKGLMVIGIYLALFAVLALSVALLIPTLVQQIGSLVQTIGSSLNMVTSNVQSLRDFATQHGLEANIAPGIESLQSQLTRAASGLFVTLTGIFGGLAGFIIVLVMAFYMVVQEEEAIRTFHNLVPEKYQDLSVNLIKRVEEKIGAWLRGQLLVSFIIGLMYYVALLILGIQSPLVLAVFAGFTEFIPYLGPILGGIPIVIVAFGQSPIMALFAIGLVLIVQQIENQIIVPNLMKRAIGLNPLISIVAILVGGKLFGVVGALLAIPIATSLIVAITELYRYKQERA